MILYPDKIITGDGKTVLNDHGVLVREGKIHRVAPLRNLREDYPQEEIIEYPDTTLLPGLSDVHAHLGYHYDDIGQRDRSEMLLAYCIQHKLTEALKRGITLIRDVASPQEMGKTLQFAQEHGYLRIPRVVASGAGLCTTGGHFHYAYPGVVEVDGVEKLLTAVRCNYRSGYSWTKLMTTDRTEISEYTKEELTAATREAHRLGMKVAVHATNRAGIQLSIEAGVDSIEHSCEMTDEQAQRMISQDIWWVPTILTYRLSYESEKRKPYPNALHLARYERAVVQTKEHFLRFYQNGIRIAAGTDRTELPIDKELECMVEMGLTPVEAIRTATWNAARMLDLDSVTGRVQDGLDADLLIVSGDAETDITALSRPVAVYFHGEKV